MKRVYMPINPAVLKPAVLKWAREAVGYILALKENGQSLPDRRGGIQVIYPTEGKDSVETPYAKKAAFWCWYVRSVIVGNLPNDLRIGNERLKQLPTSGEAFSFEAPSGFQFEQTRCPATVRVPLSSIIDAKNVSLHLLSGNSKVISTDKFDLILSGDKKAFPVNCDGPFALVDRTKTASLKPPVLARDIEMSVASIEKLQ
jgi:hypothetical protein